mmetsp:Transcript_3167/g.7702  ORF Transcript_3167/g.7702 Transcript_3167/m.7702 type:complete len:264 (+) Transcript_3167:1095-1886(+)
MTWKCVGVSCRDLATWGSADSGNTFTEAPSSLRLTPRKATRPLSVAAGTNASKGAIWSVPVVEPSNALMYVKDVFETISTSSSDDCVSLEPTGTSADHRTSPVSISSPNTRPASLFTTTAILSNPYRTALRFFFRAFEACDGWKTSFTLSMRPSAKPKQASNCNVSRCEKVGILLFLLIFFGAASTKTGSWAFARASSRDHATLSPWSDASVCALVTTKTRAPAPPFFNSNNCGVQRAGGPCIADDRGALSSLISAPSSSRTA